MEKTQITRGEIARKIQNIDAFLNKKLFDTEELRKTASNIYVKSNNLDYENNISNWNEDELLHVLSQILDGMIYFYKHYSDYKSFPIGNYNNIKKVFDGSDNTLFINKKSIYRFSPLTQMIINKYRNN